MSHESRLNLLKCALLAIVWSSLDTNSEKLVLELATQDKLQLLYSVNCTFCTRVWSVILWNGFICWQLEC